MVWVLLVCVCIYLAFLEGIGLVDIGTRGSADQQGFEYSARLWGLLSTGDITLRLYGPGLGWSVDVWYVLGLGDVMITPCGFGSTV